MMAAAGEDRGFGSLPTNSQDPLGANERISGSIDFVPPFRGCVAPDHVDSIAVNECGTFGVGMHLGE